MTRRFDGIRILIATHNAGKLEEMAQLFAPHGVEVVGAAEMNLPEPDETVAVQALLCLLDVDRTPGDDHGCCCCYTRARAFLNSSRPSRRFGLVGSVLCCPWTLKK